MRVLVTGAKGFVGSNLVANLKNIKDGKNKTRPNLSIDEVYEYDIDNSLEELEEFCSKCDFVFNFAGVNRPQKQEEFRKGNIDFVQLLINFLSKYNNSSPIMLSSSIQATLSGRYGESEYGLSKRAAEDLLFQYSEKKDVQVYVFRFPNLVGKWIRPNYNSAVGTFCYNIAHELPIHVDDPSTELSLLFIDDLINEMYSVLEGKVHRCVYPVSDNEWDGVTPKEDANGVFCFVPSTYKVSLGYIVSCLRLFHDFPDTLLMPKIEEGSFEKKLYSVYLSYLSKEKCIIPLKMNLDERGSFTEILKTSDHGQFSVNISKPGITKGQHWHNSKWELFIVVSGHGLIQERKIGSEEIIEFEVSGENLQAVYMLPGYTHNIINLSEEENLVTLMWANEIFDSKNPDTFYELVEKENDYMEK